MARTPLGLTFVSRQSEALEHFGALEQAGRTFASNVHLRTHRHGCRSKGNRRRSRNRSFWHRRLSSSGASIDPELRDAL